MALWGTVTRAKVAVELRIWVVDERATPTLLLRDMSPGPPGRDWSRA